MKMKLRRLLKKKSLSKEQIKQSMYFSTSNFLFIFLVQCIEISTYWSLMPTAHQLSLVLGGRFRESEFFLNKRKKRISVYHYKPVDLQYLVRVKLP